MKGHNHVTDKHAFSMVELIGALAVVAVLTGALVPCTIRLLDRLVAQKEVATLKTLGDSFQKAILRQRTIPAQANWPSFMAAEAGMSLDLVNVNPRHQTRAFVADPDPANWLASHPLPYTNGPSGSAAYPSSARVMFISSLGARLPDIESGMNTTEFQYLWDAPDGTIPDSQLWKTYDGDPQDVKVQRINLGSLFNHLVLSSYLGTTPGYYKIDGLPAGTSYLQASISNGVAGYFLKSTVVDLYASAPAVAFQESDVLDQDTSFVYEKGVWRKSIAAGVAVGTGDISGIVEAFLKAPENINAAHTNGAGLQQFIIVTNFIAYMSNYNRWEDAGFTDNGLKTYLQSFQPQMMQSVSDLYQNSDKHFPTNNYLPCVPTINP
jgi:type II secretory pathway pseudopilin PulG